MDQRNGRAYSTPLTPRTSLRAMRIKATSWLSQETTLGLAMMGCMLAGCKSAAKDQPATETNAAQSAAAATAATPSAAAPKAPGAAAAGQAGNCPAGRWSYDYSDNALEILMNNVAGAQVVKKEGSFICTVSEGSPGTVVCETQGKPVENVVETNQAGMKMVISVTIDGKATTAFTLVDARHMKVTSSDTSKLKIATKVSLGGKPMPFPTDKLVSIFGKPESTLEYKCEDGKLFLKPQIDKVDSPWQRLDPAK
jgi:hypothetical protein